MRHIAATIAPTGAPLVDGAIIGPPPGPKADATFSFSGQAARQLAALADLGLTIRVMDAPIGAAAARR